MTVHSLVLYENGTYTEISKEFDLSIHNSVVSPKTQHLVEDHFITFFYPENTDDEVVQDYVRHHNLHLLEGRELTPVEKQGVVKLSDQDSALYNFPNGYKMFRIHYWTDRPTRWELNPDADLFVFNSNDIQKMVMFN